MIVAFLAAGLAGGIRSGAAQSAPATENGVFLIRSNGREIGSERFRIRQTASGWEATGELRLEVPGGPWVLETSSLQMDANWMPTSYERLQQAPQKGSLTAEFSADGTLLTSNAEASSLEQIFLLPNEELVVLDTNFFHQYSLLLRQFDGSGRVRQSFNVFVPQEATPSIIRVTLVGRETLPVQGTPVELQHFQAATEDIRLEIWTTDRREIQRIEIPQANLEIVRQP